MNFNDYQKAAGSTVLCVPGIPNSLHMALKLCGEAGEVRLCKKSGFELEEELGDILWYLANGLTSFGEEFDEKPWSFSELALESISNNNYVPPNNMVGLMDQLFIKTSIVAESVGKLIFTPDRKDKVTLVAELREACINLLDIIVGMALFVRNKTLGEIMQANIDKLKERYGD